ncbi:MAG: redoxin domain-containing protein [Bacteroidota bacterium]
MKNWTLILCLLSVSALFWQCSAADAAQENLSTRVAENADFTLEIIGMGAGNVRLIGILNDQQYLADEATSDENGVVRFQKNEPYKQGLYFVLLPNNTNFTIVVAEDQTFNLRTSLNDLSGQMQVEGSVDNQLFYQVQAYEGNYQRQLAPLNQQLNTSAPESGEYQAAEASRQKLINARRAYLEDIFNQHPNSFFTVFKKAGQNPELRKDLPNDAQVTAYRMEFWDGVDFTDERLMNTPVIYNKLTRYFEDLTPQQPDSIVISLERILKRLPSFEQSEYYKYFVNWVALNYEPSKTTLMDSEAVFVHIAQNHITYDRAFWTDSTNIYAIQLRAAEMANSLVGQAGPNVKAPDENGTSQAIYDLKAPYIVVYLYNPDCEHCQEQSPVLVDLHRQWQQQSPPLADVYAIAIDTEEDIWKDYIRKTGMNWANVFDPTNRSIYKTYYVNITPEVYVLDPDRKIIAKNLNVNQIEEVIRRDQAKR